MQHNPRALIFTSKLIKVAQHVKCLSDCVNKPSAERIQHPRTISNSPIIEVKFNWLK